MPGGLIGVGRSYQNSAIKGLRDYTTTFNAMEAERDATNKQLKAAEKSQNMGLGAAAGMAAGAFFGPIGMGVGALVGGLGGSLF